MLLALLALCDFRHSVRRRSGEQKHPVLMTTQIQVLAFLHDFTSCTFVGIGYAENEDSDIAEMATANTKRRRLESDQHLFSNSSFHLSPAQGSIWPGMEAEITVTFQPDHAREYKAMAYCDVGGRATRLPIQLCGTGIGPKAVFSYDLLDVGEAFINTPHKYEVELLNRCAAHC